jgi:hypothetical protein
MKKHQQIEFGWLTTLGLKQPTDYTPKAVELLER